MAQSGYTAISLYKSSTAGVTPSAGNLIIGELFINVTDGKLYYKDTSNNVKLLASNSSASGDYTSLTIDNNASALQSPPVGAGVLFQVGNANSTNTRALIDAYAANAGVLFRRSNGTAASPTAISSGDVIGVLAGLGYGATGYSSATRISAQMVASENWTDSAQGSYLSIVTTATGGTTTAEALRIGPSGEIGVATGGGVNYGTGGQALLSGGEGAPPVWSTLSGTGTVTSVALSTGSTGLTVSGGTSQTITGAGTFSIGGVLALASGGTGSSTASGARTNLGLGSLATSNSVDLTSQVTGTLPVANGGTGQTTYTNGQLLIGNTTGSTLTKATLTAGTGISITNGAGSITIAATGAGTGTVTSVAFSTGTTGLSVTGSPITTSGTITLAGTLATTNGGTGLTGFTSGGAMYATSTSALTTGTLPVTAGGTGGTTATAALTNLLPSQTGNSGKFLTTNGSSTSWGTAGTGTVTSVALSGGTTGLSVSGSPITTSGTITLSGTLATANGGTGTASTINYGFKNRIINGAMSYDQRNLGAAVGTAVDNPWLIDRWQLQTSSLTGKFNGGRNYATVTAPTGFLYNIGVTSQSAYTPTTGQAFDITQVIEGFNIQDLAWGTASAQSVTLSFWVYASTTGTYAGAIRNGAKNRSYVFTFSVTSANTWQQKTVTIAGDTSGTWDTGLGAGIWLSFSLGAYTTFETASPGSWLSGNYVATTTSVAPVNTNGATFSITGVQLERGATATAFDMRSLGQEITLCQRYFQALRADSEFDIVMMGSASSVANQANIMCPLQTPLRASPTVTYSNMLLYKESTGTGFSFTGGIKNYLANLANQVVFELTTTTSASFTGGSAVSIATSAGSSGYVFLDADTW